MLDNMEFNILCWQEVISNSVYISLWDKIYMKTRITGSNSCSHTKWESSVLSWPFYPRSSHNNDFNIKVVNIILCVQGVLYEWSQISELIRKPRRRKDGTERNSNSNFRFTDFFEFTAPLIDVCWCADRLGSFPLFLNSTAVWDTIKATPTALCTLKNIHLQINM